MNTALQCGALDNSFPGIDWLSGHCISAIIPYPTKTCGQFNRFPVFFCKIKPARSSSIPRLFLIKRHDWPTEWNDVNCGSKNEMSMWPSKIRATSHLLYCDSTAMVTYSVLFHMITPVALVRVEIFIANSTLRASLVIYHLVSSALTRGIIVKYLRRHESAREFVCAQLFKTE